MLVGCASPGTSVTQTVRVETPGCALATCELHNDRGQWRLASTPGQVSLATSAEPLRISCSSTAGGLSTASAAGSARPLSASGAVVGATAGAVTAGAAFGATALAFIPVLGVAILVTGAAVGAGAGHAITASARALSYPELISVPMSCSAPAMTGALGLAGPKLGLQVRGLPVAEGIAAGIGERGAVWVLAVAEKSPAAVAGLRSGDILLSANGHDLLDASMLEEALQTETDGTPLRLQVWRDGSRLATPLLLGSGRP
jgi:S1-C subfamily serine protease